MIRPFVAADEKAVLEIWSKCGLVVPQNDPVKDIRRKERVNPELFLVAEEKGAVIGTCMAGYEGHRGWINYLAVSPDHRRCGLGANLVREAERLLREAGCPKINLQVRATNSAVIAFYEAVGFSVDSVTSMGKRLEIDAPHCRETTDSESLTIPGTGRAADLPATRMIHAIHHVQVTIPRGEEDRARAFYCDVLGLTEIPKPETLAGRGGFWLSVGDRQLHVGVEDGIERSRTKAHVAYHVFDLETSIARLSREGIHVERPPEIPGFIRVELRDPFGNRVELIQTASASSFVIPERRPLESRRLVLVPHEAEHAQALHEASAESVPEIFPWMEWCHPGYSLSEAGSWIDSQPAAWATGRAWEFLIFEKESGVLVGANGINLINQAYRYANLGYWIRSSRTGRGYATEAAQLLAEFAFRHTDLNRLEIVAAIGNTASQRVAEKVSARREGVMRKRMVIHGTAHDAVLFSLVREDTP